MTAGAGAFLVAVAAGVCWRDVYCLLFLDHRLVGRWQPLQGPGSEARPGKPNLFLEFTRDGRINSVLDWNVADPSKPLQLIYWQDYRCTDGREIRFREPGSREWLSTEYHLEGSGELVIQGFDGEIKSFRRLSDSPP